MYDARKAVPSSSTESGWAWPTSFSGKKGTACCSVPLPWKPSVYPWIRCAEKSHHYRCCWGFFRRKRCSEPDASNWNQIRLSEDLRGFERFSEIHLRVAGVGHVAVLQAVVGDLLPQSGRPHRRHLFPRSGLGLHPQRARQHIQPDPSSHLPVGPDGQRIVDRLRAVLGQVDLHSRLDLVDDGPFLDERQVEAEPVVGDVKIRSVLPDPVPELLEEFLLANAVPGDRLLRRHVIGEGDRPDADDAAESSVERGPLVVLVLLLCIASFVKVFRVLERNPNQLSPLLFGSLYRLDVQHHFHGSKDFHMMIPSWQVRSFLSTAPGRTASSENPSFRHRRRATWFSAKTRLKITLRYPSSFAYCNIMAPKSQPSPLLRH